MWNDLQDLIRQAKNKMPVPQLNREDEDTKPTIRPIHFIVFIIITWLGLWMLL